MLDNPNTGSDKGLEVAPAADKTAGVVDIQACKDAAKAAREQYQYYKDGGKTGITGPFGKLELSTAAVNARECGSESTSEPLPSAMDAIRDAIADGNRLMRERMPSRRPSPDLSEEDIRGGDRKADRASAADAPARKPREDASKYLKYKDEAGSDVLESPDHRIKITSLSNGDTVIDYADGQIKEVYEWKDGGSESTYRNGDVETEFQDGSTLIQFKSGDTKSIFKDSKSGATVTELRNGHKITDHEGGAVTLEFPQGSIAKISRSADRDVTRTEYRDGPIAVEDVKSDGTIMRVMRDKSHVIVKPDETTTEIREDGTLTVRDKNGKVLEQGTVTTLEDGVTLTEYGTQRTWDYGRGHKLTQFDNGPKESETEFPNGVIRTKFREGEIDVQDYDPKTEMIKIVMRDRTRIAIDGKNDTTTTITPDGTWKKKDNLTGKILQKGRDQAH